MRQAFDPFSRTYAAARERFREAARAAAGVIESHVLPGQGPDGCELAVDVALVGARNPRRAVVVSSGLHGVEGFFGSAVQLAWLRRLRGGALSIPGGTLVVLPHAVNPFGFAWRRRANEDNVDLNRNFLDDGETYGGVPEHYDGVHDLLNPPAPPSRLDAFRLRAAWAVRRHGLSVLQNAVATGQYEHPAGLFFGGREAAVSTRLVQERFWDWSRAAEEVVHLDLHTGLGAYADYRLLIEPPHVHDLGWYRSRFDPERVAAVGGDTPYAARGVMGAWLARHAGPRGYRFACLELGTYGTLRVLAALRAENRAHHHSGPGAAAYRRAKRELVECFCPASGVWRRKALDRALEVIEQALVRGTPIAAPERRDDSHESRREGREAAPARRDDSHEAGREGREAEPAGRDDSHEAGREGRETPQRGKPKRRRNVSRAKKTKSTKNARTQETAADGSRRLTPRSPGRRRS